MLRRNIVAWLLHEPGQTHSRPQSPRSFWPVAGIESSGLVQHRKSAIHGLIVKSSKSDWLRIRNEYSAHAQKIGSRQSSRSLPQARRIVGSGDENGPNDYQSRSQIPRVIWSAPRHGALKYLFYFLFSFSFYFFSHRNIHSSFLCSHIA